MSSDSIDSMDENINGVKKTVPELPPFRKMLADKLEMPQVDALLGFVILINVGLVVLETNCQADQVLEDQTIVLAKDIPDACPVYLDPSNTIILIFYLCELFLRLFVWRCEFFKEPLSILDFMVVLVDVFIKVVSSVTGEEAVPLLSLLRVARLLKLTRAVRLMMLFPELNLMLRGLFSAFKAIFWGVVMILLILIIFGVLAVQLIHDVNLELTRKGYWKDNVECYRCPQAFATVENSVLTFMQQIIAGDSWGMVTVPLIEEAPVTSVFFVSALVLVSLAIMNLILAVIVEKASEAKAETVTELNKRKEEEFERHKQNLKEICKEIDKDESGNISMDEIMEGFETNRRFQHTMKSMDIDQEDVGVVFEIMDEDGSGDVNYDEFVEQLHKMKTHDAHTILIFIKYYVIQIKKKLESSPLHNNPYDGCGKSPSKNSNKSAGKTDKVEQEITDTSSSVFEINSLAEAQVHLENMRKADQEMLQAVRILTERSAQAHLQLQQAICAYKEESIKLETCHHPVHRSSLEARKGDDPILPDSEDFSARIGSTTSQGVERTESMGGVAGLTGTETRSELVSGGNYPGTRTRISPSGTAQL